MHLVRKELRAMVPFVGLVVFICVLNVVDEFVRYQPDMRPLADTMSGYVAMDEAFSVPLFLLVFALGSGLLVREHDEGTMEFLDSLPVSRGHVFWTKVVLASVVLWLLPLTNVAIAATLQGWSRTSLDPSFHWQLLLMSLFLYTCQTTIFLALALALSFLRRFGWLVAALLFWGYVLASRYFPAVASLNVLELVSPRFEGERWLLPVDLLKVQLPLAAALIAVAYFVFVGAGDRMIRGYKKLSRSRAGGAALVGTGVVATILAISAFAYYMSLESARDGEPTDPDAVRVVYSDWTTARAQSRFFTFTYPSNLADRAAGVISPADEVHEAVRQFLDAPSAETKIVVDMTGSLRHLGTAHWNTVRMNLTASEETDRLLAILGHETTHVYIDRLSDSRLLETFDSTRFFHEGLATYLEHRLFGSAETVQPGRSIAAIMRQRREVDFEELVDGNLLQERRDPNLVYPLGEVFVAALVDRHGDRAPGRLLRAFARKDRPQEMSGRELWRDSFQSAGFNLEGTIDAFFARLDTLVAENKTFIAGLPRPRGVVRYKEGLIGVEPVWMPVEGWSVICRFRQFAGSEELDYIDPYYSDDDNAFWIPSDELPAATFWFQIGLSEDDGSRVIWEPWSEANSQR